MKRMPNPATTKRQTAMARVDVRIVCSGCGKEPDTGALLTEEGVSDADEIACAMCESLFVVTRSEETEREIVKTVGEIRQAILAGPRRGGEVWN